MAAADWYADPSGRYEKRYYDGSVWTESVIDGSRQGRDPIGDAAPPPPSPPHAHAPASYAVPQQTPPSYVAPAYGAPSYGAPSYVVVTQSHSTGNGFAVAGLTVGIIAVLIALNLFGYVAGGIFGVLALTFGLLGLRAVQTRGAALGGLATAGVVLGAVAISLSAYNGYRVHRAENALRHIFQPAVGVVAVDANPTINEVHITKCYRDGGTGAPAAAGSVKNTSHTKQAFRVTVAFHFKTYTMYGVATTDKISAGKTAQWTAIDTNASLIPESCTAVNGVPAQP